MPLTNMTLPLHQTLSSKAIHFKILPPFLRPPSGHQNMNLLEFLLSPLLHTCAVAATLHITSGVKQNRRCTRVYVCIAYSVFNPLDSQNALRSKPTSPLVINFTNLNVTACVTGYQKGLRELNTGR